MSGDSRPVSGAFIEICIERSQALGSAGQAPKIRVIDLDTMADRYRSGELRQMIHA